MKWNSYKQKPAAPGFYLFGTIKRIPQEYRYQVVSFNEHWNILHRTDFIVAWAEIPECDMVL